MNLQKNQKLDRPVFVEGKSFDQIPADLYIPPEYLEVFLERFEGPLDLLLYLIRKRNFDILNLPIIQITKQYLHYLQIMRQKDRDIASEYLVMAATLIQLKSRLMLPRSSSQEDDQEEDPRAQLAARLLAYEKTQVAAELLDSFDRAERNFYSFALELDQNNKIVKYDLNKNDLLSCFQDILKRTNINLEHQVQAEKMTVHEAMILLLEELEKDSQYFHNILKKVNDLHGIICCFSALLELGKQQALQIIQHEPMGEIFVQKVSEHSQQNSLEKMEF